MQRVVDSNVVAKWFLPEPHKDKAEKLLSDFLEEKVDLIAPDLIVVEVGNLLWHRSILRGDISATKASESFAKFLTIPITLTSLISHRGSRVETCRRGVPPGLRHGICGLGATEGL